MDITLSSYDDATQTLIAVMYLADLADGNTYKNTKVMKTTLEGYMKAMATYTQLPENAGRDIRREPEPHKAPYQWKEHPLIHAIYQHTKRWQGKTNRKDPLTRKMVSHIRAIGTTKHKDNFHEALADWLTVSLYTGYRGIEWIQDKDPLKHGYRKYEHPVRHTSNQIYAKCREDWDFVDTNGKTINTPLTTAPSSIAAGGDTFRFQKNPNLHGVRIEFLSTPGDAAFCPTLAKLRILHRHQRLGMTPHDPLAVYKKYKGSKLGTHFIKSGVEKRLNEAGRACYAGDTTCNRFHMRWTCHSGRIGATALLFAKHRDPLLIKNRLRWASDKFEVYIRHTPILARLHAEAGITDIDAYQIKTPVQSF